MRRLASRFVSRFLFAVMALTFLSPALGSQMVADHGQLHAEALPVDDSSLPHTHDADSDHDSAHAFAGHLFLHLPLCLSGAFQLVLPRLASGGDIPLPQFSPSFRIPELPFKPPRVLSFV